MSINQEGDIKGPSAAPTDVHHEEGDVEATGDINQEGDIKVVWLGSNGNCDTFLKHLGRAGLSSTPYLLYRDNKRLGIDVSHRRAVYLVENEHDPGKSFIFYCEKPQEGRSRRELRGLLFLDNMTVHGVKNEYGEDGIKITVHDPEQNIGTTKKTFIFSQGHEKKKDGDLFKSDDTSPSFLMHNITSIYPNASGQNYKPFMTGRNNVSEGSQRKVGGRKKLTRKKINKRKRTHRKRKSNLSKRARHNKKGRGSKKRHKNKH